MTIIFKRKTIFSTAWFDLIEKEVCREGKKENFYTLKVRDYVSVIAKTRGDRIVLVRQYRPSIERITLEFPSGHVDAKEAPERAARRELYEETGYEGGRLSFLGVLWADTGRLSNRQWCYFIEGVKLSRKRWKPEPFVVSTTIARRALFYKLRNGSFDHALNLSVLALAMAKNKI